MFKRTILFLFSLSLCSFLSAMQPVDQSAEGILGGNGGLGFKIDTSRPQSDLEAAKKDAEYMRAALKAAREKNRTELGYGFTHFAIQ